MIERWFPCQEVSEASQEGWGSGNSEATLFPWFAKRPLAQARAAVLTSLLPWPEEQPEQLRLQELVRQAMRDYDSAHDAVEKELQQWHDDIRILDLFSGRAMIPLEAARYGATAYGIDYSPVATLAGRLLADYPLRYWDGEPELPFGDPPDRLTESRLTADVERTFRVVSRKFIQQMQEFYPIISGRQPWGYLWSVTLPCQECGRRFPLTGSLVLRPADPKKKDPGQSYEIVVDRSNDSWSILVHEGPPRGQPTRVLAGKSRYSSSGKVAVCPFCDHVHLKDVHTRLASERLGKDEVLLAGEIDEIFGKTYREVMVEERSAIVKAEAALREEAAFPNGLPAVPNEAIPEGNTWTVQATVYGAKTYGDMCNARQTLGFVRLARIIANLGTECLEAGTSPDYAAALCGYASAVLARKLRRSTRGSALQPSRSGVTDIFATESSIAFSYDFFEAGLGSGPGTWDSLASTTLSALRRQVARKPGKPAIISQGTALALPFRDQFHTAVVTDPPYDAMIDYTDASDLFYVWLKRAMSTSAPELSFTAEPHGVQEKNDEIIVKKGGSGTKDFRTRARYDELIAVSFAEAGRVVADDGVVTIVFGHGEPEVWHRLLRAISNAGLVLTGSWPAKTEKGGKVGFSNIVTTLTMVCRPAPVSRPIGRANSVEAEVRRVVGERVPMWESAGLAPTDQLMASAGPAMEVVGRYSVVLDNVGEPVEPDKYLLVARRAVETAAAIDVDHLPLETFDPRTRFALSWVRLYERKIAPKSEARWQALAADLELDRLKGVLQEDAKGVRFAYAKDQTSTVKETSEVIDVALAMAGAWVEGLDAVGEILAQSGRDQHDPYLWAAMTFLSSRLPEADPDAMAWTSLVRNKKGIGTVTRQVAVDKVKAEKDAQARRNQGTLFDVDEEAGQWPRT
jgi:adenine-specific DNA methylase